MTDDTSTTFGGWSDRLTYVLAEGQLIALGTIFTVGALLVIYRPQLPTVPPIVVGWLSSLMLFGPPLLGFWVTFVRRLRTHREIAVHEIDGRGMAAEKYYVDPETWSEKSVEGAGPYPMNDGAAWGVQNLDYHEDLEDLEVRGVWLTEASDPKLLTAKSHMDSIYEKLTQSHIQLNVMRDSVSELGADIQQAIINSNAEAREKGTMMDETAVSDVFEDFSEDIGDVGESDLPTLDIEEEVTDAIDEPKQMNEADATPADD